MYLYGFLFAGLSWVLNNDAQHTLYASETFDLEKYRAIRDFRAGVARLRRRDRVFMITDRHADVKVWRIESTWGGQGMLYADRNGLYVNNAYGIIRPLDWSEVPTDELRFIIFTLNFY